MNQITIMPKVNETVVYEERIARIWSDGHVDFCDLTEASPEFRRIPTQVLKLKEEVV